MTQQERFNLLVYAIQEARADVGGLSVRTVKEDIIKAVEFYFDKYVELLRKE